MTETFTDTELEIFATACASGAGLRKTFAYWISIGEAYQIARKHADAEGGNPKKRKARLREILEGQDLAWVGSPSRKTEILYLERVMGRLKEVQRWRETLTDFERTRWSSPQSVHNRCKIFHPNGKTKGPVIKRTTLSVSALLHKTGADAAQLLYDRNPSKTYALYRALIELLGSGTAPRPISGWAATRERESAGHAA